MYFKHVNMETPLKEITVTGILNAWSSLRTSTLALTQWANNHDLQGSSWLPERWVLTPTCILLNLFRAYLRVPTSSHLRKVDAEQLVKDIIVLDFVTAQLQSNLTQLNAKLVLQTYWCVTHPTPPTKNF